MLVTRFPVAPLALRFSYTAAFVVKKPRFPLLFDVIRASAASLPPEESPTITRDRSQCCAIVSAPIMVDVATKARRLAIALRNLAKLPRRDVDELHLRQTPQGLSPRASKHLRVFTNCGKGFAQQNFEASRSPIRWPNGLWRQTPLIVRRFSYGTE